MPRWRERMLLQSWRCTCASTLMPVKEFGIVKNLRDF